MNCDNQWVFLDGGDSIVHLIQVTFSKIKNPSDPCPIPIIYPIT